MAPTPAAPALATAACSGSGPSGGPSSGGGSETCTSDDHGFSITCDTLLTQGTPSGGTDSGPGSAFDIAFVDTGGTDVDGRYIDGIRISVHELNRTVEPDVDVTAASYCLFWGPDEYELTRQASRKN